MAQQLRTGLRKAADAVGAYLQLFFPRLHADSCFACVRNTRFEKSRRRCVRFPLSEAFGPSRSHLMLRSRGPRPRRSNTDWRCYPCSWVWGGVAALTSTSRSAWHVALGGKRGPSYFAVACSGSLEVQPWFCVEGSHPCGVAKVDSHCNKRAQPRKQSKHALLRANRERGPILVVIVFVQIPKKRPRPKSSRLYGRYHPVNRFLVPAVFFFSEPCVAHFFAASFAAGHPFLVEPQGQSGGVLRKYTSCAGRLCCGSFSRSVQRLSRRRPPVCHPTRNTAVFLVEGR